MALNYSFDVETMQAGRWVIDCVSEREFPARKRANELLANPKCAGARIIRTWKRPDGVSVDTEIFCQTREVKDDEKLRVTQVDTPIVRCQTLKDFFGFESRQAMSRIFRTYLARFALTPTEIIHNLWHLRRLDEKDGLIRAAVDMVATLQTNDGVQDVAVRRAEIYAAFESMLARARAIDTASLPKLDRKFSDVMASLGGFMDSDERRYLMLTALSRELGKLPSWLGKLELLCRLATEETEPEVLDMLDGVIADVLGTDVVRDLLGVQRTLRITIFALLDLAEGIAPQAADGVDITRTLCQLLALGKLPLSRRAIIDRAHRALRSPNLLRPNDPAQEPEELRKLIARLITPVGLHSGADTAHALTTRFTRMVEQGGKTGRRAAIEAAFRAMPDLAYGTIYLCDLGRSAFAEAHLADMQALLDQVLKAKDITDFCRGELAPNERMARATAAYHAVTASPYAPEIRASVTGHIDTLLERFIIKEKIIDRLDLTDSHLRDRATRLVWFCQSGLLPKGQALKTAQGRVLAVLRQPDFTTRFVRGLPDPQAARAALRDFFDLLKSSGMHDG
jgi:hypothetical protein